MHRDPQHPTGPGTLALVVGPSGAGKDSLIRAARDHLSGDPRFSFPRRIVTRAAVTELEDHDSLDRDDFQRRRQRGDFALAWEAHGLGYALPANIGEAILAGRVVVANVSRRMVEEAVQRFRQCHVFHVTARPEVLARRLASRGRETDAEVAARLGREEPAIPAGVPVSVIENSGAIDDAVRQFVRELMRLSR